MPNKSLTQIDFCFIEIEFAEKIGLLSEAHARAKGHEFKTNPTIDPFFHNSARRGKLQLALAIDTSVLSEIGKQRVLEIEPLVES